MAAAKHIKGTSLHFPVLTVTEPGVFGNVEDDPTTESESDHKVNLYPSEDYPTDCSNVHWCPARGPKGRLHLAD